jgi:hypothetical protein
MKNVVNGSLQPALARVVAQRSAQRRGLDPRLDVAEPLAEAGRLAVNRILQPLDELLEVADPGLERPELSLAGADGGRLRGLIGLRGTATNLPDPPYQTFALVHVSPPAGSLDRRRAGRVAPSLLVGHPADHQRPAVDLLANQRKLLFALLRGALALALHPVSPRGRAVT